MSAVVCLCTRAWSVAPENRSAGSQATHQRSRPPSMPRNVPSLTVNVEDVEGKQYPQPHGRSIAAKHLEEDGCVKKQGILSKRLSGTAIHWGNRYVTLTAENMYIRHEEHGDNRHAINLLSITHARSVLGTRATLPQAGSARDAFAARSDDMESVGLHADSFNRLQWEHAFEVYVERLGRTYYFRASTDEDCKDWLTAIHDAISEAKAAFQRSLQLSRAKRTRMAVQQMYEHDYTQAFVSLLLLSNFVISIIQSELAARQAQDVLEALDQGKSGRLCLLSLSS